ncbi:DNA primase regulatory subunit PriL [Thermoplasma sp.]|uniref:DNA primase regulatory subunit PriL n=1 Tax=Thermoplasma sp. TaxID=1973142 RepID=UPI0025DAF5FC|nr:DNA primase regulatory subunit PriL [Thermoplasma sp.]
MIREIAGASISEASGSDLNSEYASIKKAAFAFVEGAVRGDQSYISLENRELAFIIWILVAIDENIITARTIIKARDTAEKQLIGAQHYEDLEEFGRRLGIDISVEGEQIKKDHLYRLDVTDFATYASRVTGSRYRLSNQIVRAGYVYVQNDVMVKILREAFVSFLFGVMDQIRKEDAVTLLRPVSDDLERIKEAYRKAHGSGASMGKGDASMFPPCINEIIKNLESGVNVSHMGRLALASFLHKAGYSEDEIVSYFRNAPDFDENITRYQIKHISGEISGTEYTPPKCETMRSNHLCYMDDDPLCHREWMKHPLTYYEVKRRNRKIR